MIEKLARRFSSVHFQGCTRDVNVRWMIRRDAQEVLDIESRCFTCSWSKGDLVRQLRQSNMIGMVAEVDEQVVGYMVYELLKQRIDLLRIAVHPDYQRHGVGAAMLLKLTGKLTKHRRNRACAVLCERNLPSQLFFSRCGWWATDVLRDFWNDEDGYFFEYRCEW